MKSFTKKILKFIYPGIPILLIRKRILRWCGYHIGRDVYIPASLKISDLKQRRNNLFVGDRVSFGPNVLIITDSSPNNSKLIKLFPMKSEDVVINNDVWIGANVTILPGVTIGKCSVIGAGAIVNKSIPAYSIAVGNPVKVIKEINSNEL